MTAKLIVPASELAVTLQEAKDGLRIDGDDLDAQIELWVKGITTHAERYMRRALIKQTWEMTIPGFEPTINLPMPPIISVSIKYYDPDGNEQVLNSDQFRFNSFGILKPLAAWPATQSRDDAVTITYDCGFGEDAAATPPDIKLYIIARLVEQFDPAVRLEKDTVQAAFIDRLLDPYCAAWYS